MNEYLRKKSVNTVNMF